MKHFRNSKFEIRNWPKLILSVVALILSLAVSSWAQGPPRIAWLWSGTVEGTGTIREAFLTGMRENGMVEGMQYVLLERYAGGKYDRFPTLAEELVKRDPAILMINTIAAGRAVQRTTKVIPIVFVHISDPVGSGLVASLARPGGNITGLANQAEDVIEKYVELARQALPNTSRLAALVNPSNPTHPKLFGLVSASASAAGIAARAFEVRSPEEFEGTFGEIARYRPDALLGVPEAMFFDQRERICSFAARQRIPAIFPQADFVTSGCLMSYASSRSGLHRRSALFVKKILAGAKPADLPVEQPAKFDLLINLKTAKGLGLTIPQSLLMRADEVIE
jgi:putative ABC transport system substrate-binding protein